LLTSVRAIKVRTSGSPLAIWRGEEKSFKIFYGAGLDETDALGVARGVGTGTLHAWEVDSPVAPKQRFGDLFLRFKGVGGEVVTPPTGVPDAGRPLPCWPWGSWAWAR
jgi:hypothetical protein